MTFSEFKKLKIDTTKIGWQLPSKYDTAYFCTPKGAKMIGCAGVDGIHYCTIRRFGEMIFAVSPMNPPGHYVHPIAKNMEDLLRLLLACLDMNLLEQVWAWDEEQLNNQIQEVQKSEYFDPTSLHAIREKCGLEPMEKPYEYLYCLQQSFDYGSIPFTTDYYDIVGETVEWMPPAWKVTMDGDFFPERGESGVEIPLNKTFTWGNETWHIPSAYLCSGGVVVDFFAEINPEIFFKFNMGNKSPRQCGKTTPGKSDPCLTSNPIDIEFRPSVAINGKELRNKCGYGEVWYPEFFRDDGAENIQARYLVEHYGYDLSCLWVIRRCTFPSEEKIDKIESLILNMVRGADEFSSICFTAPCVGDRFTFTHPVSNTEHILTVTGCEDRKINQNKFTAEGWIFPTHMTAIQYTVTPELPLDEIFVSDISSGDSPRRMKSTDSQNNDLCSAVAVIHSADATTVAHSACSSLYFEKQTCIEWRLNFRIKTVADEKIKLI